LSSTEKSERSKILQLCRDIVSDFGEDED
ncbi:hypothetical protein LCGC14_2281370, partial [marine sediment metagenome]